MKPEDYLSEDDLAAVNLHVLDCEDSSSVKADDVYLRVCVHIASSSGTVCVFAGGLDGNHCNNSFPHMNGGSFYDSG